MLTLAELVRAPAGTAETYTMYPGELSYFLKRLSTYSSRAKAKIKHRVATVIWEDSETVDRMVVVKVITSGRKLKRKGRKKKP